VRLAVEAGQLRGDRRGIGRYVHALLPAMLAEAPALGIALEITLGVRSASDVDAVRASLRPGLVPRVRVIPRAEWRREACDVAWYPWNFVRVRPPGGAIVPTLHDLAPMRADIDGRWWKVLKRVRARRAYTHAARAADVVLTGARAAADELVATLGVPADRIVVVPHAADTFATAADAAAAEAVLATLGVHGPFVLALASRERRKNLGVLWRAMDELAQGPAALPLVLAGGGALALPDRPWLRRPGFVSDAVLASLYARATAVVVPSRYEGFGLPVLEAMTAGGAVICADASTLPEVAGAGALRFGPDDAATLARHVRALRDDAALAAALRARGRQRAADFSWRTSARATLGAFRQAMARRAADAAGQARWQPPQ
jgi:glycosyltransferase involved in cell wall biosynthesis